ncbi:MAG: tetratricopeptide repeat protein [Muribaculaceae bacterium]|nr:tetratricopeptide repeat protein [Muribaculaceae bacterium]
MNRFAYLAITILLPALATNAQSAKSDSIYNVARSLFEAGEYSNAIPMFEQVVELDMTEFPDDSDLNGISSHWLASCHYHLGDAGKAREYEPLYYELPPIDRGLTQSAREYSRMSNSATSIDMAIHWAQRCAEEEIKALGEDHYFVYGSWCNLAQLAFNKGDEMLCREYIGKASRIAENINTTEKAWKSLFLSIEADLEFSPVPTCCSGKRSATMAHCPTRERRISNLLPIFLPDIA